YGNENKVATTVVRQLLLERRIDCERGVEEAERVAVGGRLRDELGADDTAGTAAIVDDYLLPEELGQARCDQPGEKIRAATGHERHDHAYRSGWIIRRGACGRNDCASRRGKYPAKAGACVDLHRPSPPSS